MNSVLKFTLVLLGLGVSTIAFIAKLRLRSPVSTWENNLTNDVRLGNLDGALSTLRASVTMATSGWNLMIVLGLLVVVAACLIRARRGQ